MIIIDLFILWSRPKKDLCLNYIDRTREWQNGLFFYQKCRWTYKLTIRFWLNIVKLSQNIVYKHTDTFKTWTDRQMASRRHVFFEGLAHNLGHHHHPNPSSTRGSPPTRRKKKKKIPPRWPFRINQFLNGHRGGMSFFSIVRAVDCLECRDVAIGVKMPHKSWTPPYCISTS